jgi:ribulose-phosphate 3-epimerase
MLDFFAKAVYDYRNAAWEKGMPKIAASILSADFCRLGEQVAAAEAGGADYIHCDVMDGHFVPNMTIGPLVVEAVRRVTCLPIDVHLMIEKPERYIPDFVAAGASNLTVHIETCPHLHRTIQQIVELGAQASVTLNPATPLSTLQEILPYVDMVLVMTVNPGFGGQSFIETMCPKVERLREMGRERGLIHEDGLAFDIEIDGGVNVHTVARVVEAGANVLVAGSAIFRSGDRFAQAPEIAGAIRSLRQAALEAKTPALSEAGVKRASERF